MKGTNCRCKLCGNEWVSKMLRSPIQCPKCKRKDWDGYHNSYGRLLNERVNYAGKHVCRCRLCGNEWVSHRPDPSICSNCKSTRWQVGNKPDEGVSCLCRVCGGSWVSRSAETVPKQCHKCKSTKWRVGNDVVTGVPCTCIWCDGSWVSRSTETVPFQCPKCKRVKWAGVDPFDPEGLLEPGRCKCDKCCNEWISKVAGLPKACPACKATNWSNAAVDAWIHERKNPELADCAIKWFYASTGPRGAKELQGDPLTGVHQWHVNKTGLCNICGWNNLTGVQVGNNSPTPITEAERERRKIQWEMENPGEKW